MTAVVHRTIPVRVWADVDVGIADFVRHLNTLPGVRTEASCQGTLDERGAEPYGPYVMVVWRNDEAKALLEPYGLKVEGEAFGYVYPPETKTY